MPGAGARAAQEKIIPPIAIHVAPGMGRAELRHLVGQERFAREIVERRFLMHGVLEYRTGREQREGRGHGRDRRGIAGGLGDSVVAIRFEILENLAAPAGPAHLESLDVDVVAQAEMDERLVAAEIAARQGELAHLQARVAFEAHFDANPRSVGGRSGKVEGDAVAGLRIVVVDRHGLVQADADDVEIAVAIKVADGAAVAHAQMVQAPCLGDIIELQIAAVAVGEVLLLERRQVTVAIPLRFLRILFSRLGVVFLVEISRHAALQEDVVAAVVVEVAEAGGPGPIRVGQPREVCPLHEAPVARVEKE